jgi:hypothetical protein
VFTGGYRLVRVLLKKYVEFSKKRASSLSVSLESKVERFSPAIAAGVASFFGNKVDPSFSSSFFVIWLFLRAVRTLEFAPSGKYLAPLSMIAAVEVIVPAGFNSPDEMHGSYQKFLESFSCGVDLVKMRNPGSLAIGDVCHKYATDLQFMFKHVYPSLALTSCSIYWPLHTASFVVNWLIGSRKADFAALSENILRSTAFLTGWVGTMWWAVMFNSRWLKESSGDGKVLRRHSMIWAWLGGLWVMLEKPSRRVELATYCSAHALNSLYNRYHLEEKTKGGGTILLMISCAILLHNWVKEPNFVKTMLFGDQDKDF